MDNCQIKTLNFHDTFVNKLPNSRLRIKTEAQISQQFHLASSLNPITIYLKHTKITTF